MLLLLVKSSSANARHSLCSQLSQSSFQPDHVKGLVPVGWSGGIVWGKEPDYDKVEIKIPERGL